MISKRFRRLLILLFAILVITALYMLWSPMMFQNNRTGFVGYRWPGLRALFTKEPFKIKRDYYLETAFDGLDGPYVFTKGDSIFQYRVTSEDKLLKTSTNRKAILTITVPNENHDQFYGYLKDSIEVYDAIYPRADKIIVISDIEGNYEGFRGFLVKNKVIDEEYNWTFGNGHLVLLGDFVDRGNDVTQLLWLIYFLENKARSHGGFVHYILGNHEVMNLEGNASYADAKYIKLAQALSGKKAWDEAYSFLFSPFNELGRWLRSKNAIEKIGDHLFVHGGISPELSEYKTDISNINRVIREKLKANGAESKTYDFLTGPKGVLWYRGMATAYKDYDKITETEFSDALRYFDAKKIVIGHTINPDITKDYSGRLIKTDVMHSEETYSGKTKGLLIEKGIEYIVDDKGIKKQF